jgi:hypothetical protein
VGQRAQEVVVGYGLMSRVYQVQAESVQMEGEVVGLEVREAAAEEWLSITKMQAGLI